MEPPHRTTTIFYHRHRTLILIASPPVLAFCFIRILDNAMAAEPWLNWLSGLVLWLFLFILALRHRLALAPDALDYTDFFITSHVPWTHVRRLIRRKTLGIWPVEGLEARTAGPSPHDIFIDLTQFEKRWRETPLAAILRERAPHIFRDSTAGHSAT